MVHQHTWLQWANFEIWCHCGGGRWRGRPTPTTSNTVVDTVSTCGWLLCSRCYSLHAVTTTSLMKNICHASIQSVRPRQHEEREGWSGMWQHLQCQQQHLKCSVVTVNWTETETVVFCYLQASSSLRCFRPKMARCLCVFIFFLAYTRSTIFYLFHDDVIRHSAINLHLAFYLGFVHHHRCLSSTVCGR